jgi:hypothetical protein
MNFSSPWIPVWPAENSLPVLEALAGRLPALGLSVISATAEGSLTPFPFASSPATTMAPEEVFCASISLASKSPKPRFPATCAPALESLAWPLFFIADAAVCPDIVGFNMIYPRSFECLVKERVVRIGPRIDQRGSAG